MDEEQRVEPERGGCEGFALLTILPLITLSFLVSLGFASLNLILPYYLLALEGLLSKPPDVLTRVHGTEAIAVEYGAMTTGFMATRTLFALLGGGLADNYGRRRMIITGSVIYVLVAFLYAFTTSVWQLILLRALQGVASAIVWPVAEATLVDIVPYYYRARALALYTISFQAGNILGPVIGAAAYMLARSLIHTDDVLVLLRAPFIIAAIIMLPGVAAALLVPETIRSRVKSGLRAAALGFTAVFRYARGAIRRSLYAIFVNSLVNGLALGIFTSVAMLFIMERVTANPVILGLAFFTASVIGMAAAYPIARRADRLDTRGRKKILVAAAYAARTAWLIIAFVSNVWQLLLALTLAQVSFGALLPLLRAAYAELVPSEMRGKAFGVQQAFFNAGMALGPLIGATLYKLWSNLVLLGGLLTGKQLVFVIATLLGYVGATILLFYYEPVSVENATR